MQTLRDQAARRAWTQVRSKVAETQRVQEDGPGAPPSMGDVFRQGFMHASMLQMAVCAPGRHARTTSKAQLLMARLGATATTTGSRV